MGVLGVTGTFGKANSPTHPKRVRGPQQHDLVIWTDGFVLFPFVKGGSGVLVSSSLCGADVTFSFSEGSTYSSFSAKVCVSLQALRWSRQHQQVCNFSSFRLLFCSQHTAFFLLQYQATMGPWTLISSWK